MSDIEEWRCVAGFPGIEVSSNGRVRVLPYIDTKGRKKSGLVYKPIFTNGYQQVGLPGGRRKLSVHRLVALAFCENPHNKPFVNHKNGMRSDNRPDNLEWVTHSENVLHSYRELGANGGAHGKFGLEHPCAKPIEYQGEIKSAQEWAAQAGHPVSRIYSRIFRGWTVEQALETPFRGRPNGTHRKRVL